VSIDRYFSFEQDIRGVEVNLQKTLRGDAVTHRLGAGIEYRERDTAEFRDGLSTDLSSGATTNVLLGEVFPLRDFPLSSTQEWGAYLEDVMDLGDWSFIAAVRGDRYDLSPRNDPMYAEDYPFAEIVSLDESDLSPKLGVIYRLGEGTDVYLQYSHGFRAPPYEDANIGLEVPFFNYRAIPNPDLRSETSDGFDFGVRWQGLNGGAHVSLFRTRYTDFIESRVQLGTDPVSGRTLFQSQNLSKAVIEVFEAGAHRDLRAGGADLRVDAAAYLARGENRENGQALNSVGPAQAVIGLTWLFAADTRQLRLQSTLTEAWDDRDTSRGDLFMPPGHAVFDLYFTQAFGQRGRLRFGVLNLTDRVYWNWSDVRGLGPDDPAIPYLAQAGISLSASLNYNW
jgi:hemoglobin/transferrin/lactoferrin receptor protein